MFLTLSCHQLTLKFDFIHVEIRIEPTFVLIFCMTEIYLCRLYPFCNVFNMPEKGLEFQIDFHSQQILNGARNLHFEHANIKNFDKIRRFYIVGDIFNFSPRVYMYNYVFKEKC